MRAFPTTRKAVRTAFATLARVIVLHSERVARGLDICGEGRQHPPSIALWAMQIGMSVFQHVGPAARTILSTSSGVMHHVVPPLAFELIVMEQKGNDVGPCLVHAGRTHGLLRQTEKNYGNNLAHPVSLLMATSPTTKTLVFWSP